MGSKDTPDAPDYKGAAEEQAKSSADVTRQQTYANRPTQTTPWGSVEWGTEAGIDPSTGEPVTQWNQNLTLNPQSQSALDDQMQMQAQRSGLAGGMYDQMADEFGQPIDFASARGLQDAPDAGQFDSSQRYAQDAEDAIYGQYERRAEPRMAQQKAAMETQLRNQGLTPGTEAYDYQLDQLMQQQEDSRMGAQYQATMGAGAEAQRFLGMDMSSQGQSFQQGIQGAGFGNTVRQQQISEEMQRRGYTLNEINAILTGQQVQTPQMPGFNTASKSESTQYNAAAQNQGQADLDRFNAEQMAMQGMMSGVGAIGGGFMPG